MFSSSDIFFDFDSYFFVRRLPDDLCNSQNERERTQKQQVLFPETFADPSGGEPFPLFPIHEQWFACRMLGNVSKGYTAQAVFRLEDMSKHHPALVSSWVPARVQPKCLSESVRS